MIEYTGPLESEDLRDIADDVMDLEFALSEKRRERDRMIVQARSQGFSLRAIGDACMISHQTVQNIVDRASGPDRASGLDRAAGPVPTTVDEPVRSSNNAAGTPSTSRSAFIRNSTGKSASPIGASPPMLAGVPAAAR